MFFIAVMLVIIGTVAVFTAGSITLLNTMKKKKSYYYKTSHFISVSGMLYRMKRNAATLASICIFATTVLVTLSSVVTLYWTVRSLVEERFPVSYTLVYDSEGEDPETYYEKIYAGAEKSGVKIIYSTEIIAPVMNGLRVTGIRTVIAKSLIDSVAVGIGRVIESGNVLNYRTK